MEKSGSKFFAASHDPHGSVRLAGVRPDGNVLTNIIGGSLATILFFVNINSRNP
jgi:hypothetical protein